jgi:type VI secretion system protein ImpJ
LEGSLLSAKQMFLAVSSEADRTSLPEKTLELVKVGAADHLDHLYRRGLPGLALRHVQDPPNAIPVKLGYEYFLIDTSGQEWEEVLRGMNLAAYVPAAIREPSLELVAILPPTKEK